ncbi:polyphenol oxidase, chloroplastic-like [Carica papaya]|uniref:polyphenol oxidase, chloroplastic-like n=1 Tax=Carica papaya TaxID=3649 RepID=UPI000B8CF2AC|nr:polyphenol oxidase, chloroplastic-like [Carica papaya]
MASQSSPSLFITGINDGFSSFPKKTSQVRIIRHARPNFFFKTRLVSCKAPIDIDFNGDDDDHHQNSTAKQDKHQPFINKFNRRDALIGLGGFFGGSSFVTTNNFASAAPVSSIDLTKCDIPHLPPGANPVNCCPPISTKILDFKSTLSDSPLRVRLAANLVDNDYIVKYQKATELMKALPNDDPRNFMQQANVHCAYCEGSYYQVGFPDLEFQIHRSWLFFPWHRYYLYFYEKILGKLIGDPTFALPFWNWDSPCGMQIPAIYVNPKSPLYNNLRNTSHQPPTLVDLDYNCTNNSTISNQEQLSRNLKIMYRQMVWNGKTASLFFGKAYRAGQEPNPGGGSIEYTPHSTVHLWSGDDKQPNLEDMGSFYSAGRDPLFFAHHANVDRMWKIWKTLGGKRTDLSDPDWLNANFLFYDENANLVRVKVEDCLNIEKLGYVYQDVEIPWRESKPTSIRSYKKKNVSGSLSATVAGTTKITINTINQSSFPLVLEKEVTLEVTRPRKSRSRKEKEEEEEVLVIENIEFQRDASLKFDVHINDEGNMQINPEHTEFAGSFVNVPHIYKHGTKIKTCLTLGLSDLLEDLGIEDDDSILVTLVPRVGEGFAIIGNVKIEFFRN